MNDRENDFDFPPDRTMRKTRLVACGILLALMGALAGLLGAFYFLMPMLMGGQPGLVEMKGMQPMWFYAGTMYSAGGALLLILGAGSIFLKRWSRPLILILGWCWLYCGLIGSIVLVLQFPQMRQQMFDRMAAQEPAMAAGVETAMMTGMAIVLVFGVLFGVMIPALLVWLYSHRDVKATVEFCDRKPRWTDRCPTPVLGISVTCAVSVAMIPFTAVWMPLVPVFGRIYEDEAAIGILAGIGILFLLIAWGAYRRQILAWLALVVFLVAASVSAFLTFPNFDWGVYYRKMGFPEEQIEQMIALSGIYDGRMMATIGLVAVVPLLVYLIWVLRFFRGKDEGASIAEED